jgi:hypothetical protein
VGGDAYGRDGRRGWRRSGLVGFLGEGRGGEEGGEGRDDSDEIHGWFVGVGLEVVVGVKIVWVVYVGDGWTERWMGVDGGG